MKQLLFSLLLLLFGCQTNIHAAIINDSIPPGRNYNSAKFSLWYPDDESSIRGILVLMPGYNSDGRNAVRDSLWLKLARKHEFALLGCYFTDYQKTDLDTERYCNVKFGSGQALLDAIYQLAHKSGHQELASASLLLWGFSAGGQFNYELACWIPERVIAFVVNKGGFYHTAFAPRETRNVPGIFFTGEKDMEYRKNIVKGIFSMNRKLGAVWTFAEEQGVHHEWGQSRKLAITYFNEIIPMRMPDCICSDVLKNIPENSGCIGNMITKDYHLAIESQQNEGQNSWLPGEIFAQDWVEFIKKEP
ncbi:MAG: hypothetical protein PHU98_04880 [Mariniphaga sp.]|nr:hypothetical protein [Mariniphaga sp.]